MVGIFYNIVPWYQGEAMVTEQLDRVDYKLLLINYDLLNNKI
jgi:hypothetical protein